MKINGNDEYFKTTEPEKGGLLIYVANKYNCKQRIDLESIMYKSNTLESTFIEIINTKKKNSTIGCIYRHPSMNLEEFNNQFLQN